MSVLKELSRIQKELKSPKGQFNAFGKYKYRSCEDILESVKPLLGECVLSISDEIYHVGDRYYVQAVAIIRLGEDYVSTQALAREPDTKKGMDPSQITGSASSYARKYALNGLFAIDDTKDPDATNKHNVKERQLSLKQEYFTKLQEFYGEDIPVDVIEEAKKMDNAEMRSSLNELIKSIAFERGE